MGTAVLIGGSCLAAVAESIYGAPAQADLPAVSAVAERGPTVVVSVAMLCLVAALLWLVRTLVVDIRPVLAQVVSCMEHLADTVEKHVGGETRRDRR